MHLADRVRGWGAALRRRPALLALATLLLAAVALRLVLSLAYRPAALSQFDANSYVWQAEGGLFESVNQAPGYSVFLRAAHLFSDQVAFTISVQHAISLAAAVAAWWTLRRITGSDWLGLVPAAVVLLNGDALLLEHSLMAETVFTFLIVATIAAAVGALDSPVAWRWLALAGALLGVAVWVKYAAIGLLPVLAIWAVVVCWPDRRSMPAAAGAVLAPAIAMVAALVVAQGAQTGDYGFGRIGGWGLYSRVAGFADCERFEPPPGTERLCETTPPETRPNPDWYGYATRSPAIELFGGPPTGDDRLGDWARRAVTAQPLDYASEVLGDLALLVDEQEWTNRDRSLIGSRVVSFALRSPDEHCPPWVCRPPPLSVEAASIQGWTAPEYGAYYAEFEPRAAAGVVFFQDLQRVLRVHGPLLGLAAALAIAGLLAVHGRLAKAQWLLTWSALALLVLPVATTTYNIRYAIPALPVLAAAATLAPLALRRSRTGVRS